MPSNSKFILQKNISIITTFHFNDITPCLINEGSKYGFELDITFDKYSSDLNHIKKHKADIYILALNLRDMFPEFFTSLYPMPCSEIEYRCNTLIEQIAATAKALSDSGKKVIINNFTYPPHLMSGIFDFQNPAGQVAWVDYLNKKLSELPENIFDVFIFNLQYYTYSYGVENAYDPEGSYTSKQIFQKKFCEYLAIRYLEYVEASFKTRKKCIIVDLDNTLWGGILGEDGINGIKLGSQYPGNIYRDIQHQLNQYADQGIILAICSKNNENEVKAVFSDHKDMALKYSDFIAVKANWDEKYINIKSIAEELNIGLDSIIFVDDDPFEIEMANKMLPEVQTVQFTVDPLSNLHSIQNIRSLNYLKYSEEDMKRQQHYKIRNMAKLYEKDFTSIDDFLNSLNICVEISLSDRNSLNRIAQLIQKTNQFNLTTKRYSEKDILKMMESNKHKVYSIKAKDRFGENGIVGVSIINIHEDSWLIDTFLLSCRIIGRRIEKSLLARIQKDCMDAGIGKLVGFYVPTSKNTIVKDFYAQHAFNHENDHWVLGVGSNRIEPPNWITILT